MACTEISVTIARREVDPDGRACEACGDACYLTMWQAFAVAPRLADLPLNIVLCSSCHDVLDDSQ